VLEKASGDTMSATVPQLAKHFALDQATVRRWPHRGCPVIRRGAKGPGRGALFDLAAVEAWRSRVTAPTGLSVDEVLQRIALALGECIEHDHLALRVNISREESAAVVIVVWEKCCHAFGKSYPFDQHPQAIRAAMRIL
jgi:hypothetical protein